MNQQMQAPEVAPEKTKELSKFDYLRIKADQAVKAGVYGLNDARIIANVLDILEAELNGLKTQIADQGQKPKEEPAQGQGRGAKK